MLALKPAAFVVVEFDEIADGVQAFRRGELPKSDWSQAKLDGWNMAGMSAYHQAMTEDEEEYCQDCGREGYGMELRPCSLHDKVGA